jgi:hypothetical protein
MELIEHENVNETVVDEPISPLAEVVAQAPAEVVAEKLVPNAVKSSEDHLVDMIDELNNGLYRRLTSMMHGEKLTISNIVPVTRKLIEIVNLYKVSGIEKKALVTAVLKRFIETHMKGEPYLNLILNYVFDILPFVIDEVAGVVNKYNNKNKAKSCFSCFKI